MLKTLRVELDNYKHSTFSAPEETSFSHDSSLTRIYLVDAILTKARSQCAKYLAKPRHGEEKAQQPQFPPEPTSAA